MASTTLVIATFDVDCDGTGFAFHRVSIPNDVGPGLDAIHKYAVQNELMSGFADPCEVMGEGRFLKEYGHRMDRHDRDYWRREGYFSYVQWRR